MVGVPVLGKLLGCRTVSVVGVRKVDTMGCLLGRSAAVAVAGRAVVVAAAAAGVVAVAAEEGHHNLAAAETKTDTKLLSLEYHYVILKENSLQLHCLKYCTIKTNQAAYVSTYSCIDYQITHLRNRRRYQMKFSLESKP